MLILAAVLTASMNVDLDLTSLIKRSRAKEPVVTCGIVTVGYRFRGKAGQEFRYAGDTYQVPEEGWVELIADRRRTTYAINGHSLPLDVWPRDPFGFRDIPLPSPTGTSSNTNETGGSK
ncbi:MAG: hypothetical protein M3P06_24470 [Acidobacteriota bacterium]|nr:hypothetical protein [Acidobacteriota bacterium]